MSTKLTAALLRCSLQMDPAGAHDDEDAMFRVGDVRALAEAAQQPPQLHGWQFQSDKDSPGLYLQCSSQAQREAIMRALGWWPNMPEYREDTPTGL
jgi:hypothetical protein